MLQRRTHVPIVIDSQGDFVGKQMGLFKGFGTAS